jgi:hypothetical protein
MGPPLGSGGTWVDERVRYGFGGDERKRHDATEQIILVGDAQLAGIGNSDNGIQWDKVQRPGILASDFVLTRVIIALQFRKPIRYECKSGDLMLGGRLLQVAIRVLHDDTAADGRLFGWSPLACERTVPRKFQIHW